ncbi:hypothetical protein [Saccharothrix sp. HUAS TT1]|uniref:hypothetical protein n=1 Tax=unclassified Saccharothrix TaxID=2593673 RepID=UPI00345C44A2
MVTPSHVARLRWNFANVGNAPGGGFRDLTFPITVHEMDPLDRGWYFAMQWRWSNASAYPMAYTGLQPRADGTCFTPFSLFGKGGEVVDTERCKGGADFGDGITCNNVPGIRDFRLGRRYLLTVDQDADDERLHRGWVTDETTGLSAATGAWRIPAGHGGVTGYHVGFLEYYRALASCEQLPYARVTYGRPYSTSGAKTGQLEDPAERADKPCAGKSGFRWVRNPDGSVTVEVGHRRRTRPTPPPAPRPRVEVAVNVTVGGLPRPPLRAQPAGHDPGGGSPDPAAELVDPPPTSRRTTTP